MDISPLARAVIKRGTILHSDELKKSNYPDILKYDSFLGCQSLLHISKSELINQFSDGRAQYIGDLVEDDINMALEAVRRSDLYSDYEKDTFFK